MKEGNYIRDPSQWSQIENNTTVITDINTKGQFD